MKDVEHALLRYIFELHEQGVGITVCMVMEEAWTLKPCLRLKSTSAQESIVRRFIRSHKFVHWCVTHQLQQMASEVEADAVEFVEQIKEYAKALFCDENYILNMNQTAIFLQ